MGGEGRTPARDPDDHDHRGRPRVPAAQEDGRHRLPGARQLLRDGPRRGPPEVRSRSLREAGRRRGGHTGRDRDQ